MPPDVAFCLYGERNGDIEALLSLQALERLVEPLLLDETQGMQSLSLLEEGMGIEPGAPISEAFEAAVRNGLLAGEPSAYLAGSRLVLIPPAAFDGLLELWAPHLASYAESTARAGQRLESLVARTTAGRIFSWPQLRHMVVAGLLLDLAVGSLLGERKTVTTEVAGDFVVWAFAGLRAANSFGIQQWSGAERRAMLAQVWHRRVPARSLRLSKQMIDRLTILASGGEAIEAGRTDGALEQRRVDLYLRHQAMLGRGEAGPQLRVPAFTADDVAGLAPVLRKAAEELLQVGVDPALASLEDHPWWRDRVDDDSLRHAAIRLWLEFGIDHVLESGALAAFPSDADRVTWGRCLWIEPEDQSFSLIPGWSAGAGKPIAVREGLPA